MQNSRAKDLVVAAFLCTVIASPAASGEPWQGIWSFDPAWCAVADRIGMANPAPVALTPTEFVGYENSCDITSVSDAGYGAWRIGLSCQSEGSTYDNVFTVLVRGDDMWLWDGSGEPTPFQRCPT